MPDDRVESLIAAVVDGVTATAKQVRGLTEGEIDEVERDQPAPLAQAYRSFLSLIGGGAGHFLQGSEVFYPRVLGLGTAARELLLENGVEFAWRDSDRVILMHQGYQFDFMRGTGTDPEVWSYCEGTMPGEPILSFASFSEWLEAQVTLQVAAWSRLVPWYEAEKQKGPDERRIYFHKGLPDGTVVDEL